ncbi:HTH CENPB-type domain-containing protein [Mycena sanguinolenta]|uniref:HTH CENPB-type domain-containing protein n=1 Tax=Mycena sanguinolenta TaxID=230812 RepID=A0A8H7CQ84_9AGAR|nr:HTH CENPB-type domain-containing protein [Mycena sanguinolenta]
MASIPRRTHAQTPSQIPVPRRQRSAQLLLSRLFPLPQKSLVATPSQIAEHRVRSLSPQPPTPSPPLHARNKKSTVSSTWTASKFACTTRKTLPLARRTSHASTASSAAPSPRFSRTKPNGFMFPRTRRFRIAKHRPSKFPEIEQDMVKWLLQCRDTNTVLSDSMIRTKAKDIARALGIQEDRFKASSGWIENFKHRHGVRAGVWTGEGKKNVRAARAAGVGLTADGEQDEGEVELHEAPGEGVKLLSPLHRDESRDMGEENDTDVDLELEIDEPEEARVRRIAATGSGDMIRPSWLRNPVNPPAPPPSVPPPHPSVPPTRQLPEHSPYSGAPVTPVYYEAPVPPRADEPMYDSALLPSTPVGQQHHNQTQSPNDSAYGSTLSVPSTAPPALAEAHAALDTVIRFFDTHKAGAGLIRAEERSVLDAIKCALFQAGAGVPAQHEHGPQAGRMPSHGQPQYDHAYPHQQEAQ